MQKVVRSQQHRLFCHAVLRELQTYLTSIFKITISQQPPNATVYSKVLKEIADRDGNGQTLQQINECILVKYMSHTYSANATKVYFNCALRMLLHVSALSQAIIRHVNTKSSKGRYLLTYLLTYLLHGAESFLRS